MVGFLSFFLMPPGPTQTKAKWRPKGWFDERYMIFNSASAFRADASRSEEIIMVNRVLRDDPYKSSMHNRQGLNPKQIFKAACDWGMWPIYAVGLTHMSMCPPHRNPPSRALTPRTQSPSARRRRT